VAGNIPYYITSPIVFRLMEYHRFIARAVLMVQKEVADRLTARCGSRDYGIPTVFLATVGRAQKLFDIAKENFRPVPKVDSSAIQLDFDRTAEDVADYDLFVRLVRGTFQTRRKKIKNSLERIIGTELTARVHSIDLNCRPEELSPEQFRELANEVHKIYG
jgi:16S rRNA (adenine1518-N6/adenine1519-N6)-dimethyltransferase